MYSQDFPVIQKYSYLDNAATSLKPLSVVNKISEYYSYNSTNIHRGIYKLSEQATEEYEKSREHTAKFFNSNVDEVIFTKNATESLNLLSYTLGHSLNEKNLVLSTIMEHHSNFVPWQFLSQYKKVKFDVISLAKDNVNLDYNELEEKIKHDKPSIMTFMHVSNVLGTINNAEKIISLCNDLKIKTILDCAQSAPHMKVDFKRLNCDFIALSAHKMLGPNGLGVLIGKKSQLEDMPPFLCGGSMISSVQKDSFKLTKGPQKYEAGTPPIAEVIGFNESLNYIEKVNFENIHKTERELLSYTLKRAEEYEDILDIYSNTSSNSTGIFTFNIKKVSPHDVASILDEYNVCIRAGNHCAQPLHTHLGINGSVRASYYFYNTKKDVDNLFVGIDKIKKMFI